MKTKIQIGEIFCIEGKFYICTKSTSKTVSGYLANVSTKEAEFDLNEISFFYTLTTTGNL